MSRRGCLLAAALVIIVTSALGWALLTPRAWQTGGIMPTPSHVGIAIGLVMFVISLPRRAKVWASLALLAGASLLLGLWPSWEGRAFQT